MQQQNKKNASFKIIGEWLQLGNEKQVVLSFFPDGRLTTNNQLINSQMNDAAGMNKASFGYKYLDTAGLGYLDIILYKDAQHNTEYLRIKLIAKHNGNDTLMLNVYNNSSATIRPRSFKDSGALVWVRKN
ncbi:MAG: hypothetical protein SGJ04_00375 [Bacteroidota bacterium]|nr:hypothetical protein [Bacteroidota bacterium]